MAEVAGKDFLYGSVLKTRPYRDDGTYSVAEMLSLQRVINDICKAARVVLCGSHV